jgi:hypothetical protein
MKPKIAKDAWKKLPQAVQDMYEESGDNYVLKEEFKQYASTGKGDDPDPDDDNPLEAQIAKILGAKQHEKTLRKDAEDKLKTAEAALKAITDKEANEKHKAAKESGNVEALEKSWKAKLAAREKELQEEVDRLNSALGEATVGKTSAAMAAEISKAPTLVEPLIRARLKPEILDDGTIIERVLDAAGKPSAMTVDELKAEIAGQPDLKDVIKGHIAKGGDVRPGGDNDKGRSQIKLSDYKGKDGMVLWQKVSDREAEEPGFLAKFKAALKEAKENGEWDKLK